MRSGWTMPWGSTHELGSRERVQNQEEEKEEVPLHVNVCGRVTSWKEERSQGEKAM
jgi:hypothetical protein